MGNVAPVLLQALGFAAPIAGKPLGGVLASAAITAAQKRTASRARAAEERSALEQLQAQQALQSEQLAAQTALERERITAAAKVDEDNRRAALKRAAARQRASFGGSGIGNSSGGSTQAVLLGLFEETEEELANREALDNLRNRALDLNISNNNSVNVLQRTQLQERQRIKRLGDGLF